MLALLILVTLAIFSLPLMPTAAFLLWRRSDLGPPALSQGTYAPDHFAQGLLAKLRAYADTVSSLAVPGPLHLFDAQELVILPAISDYPHESLAHRLTYSLGPLTLPPDFRQSKELAVEGSLDCGERGTYRALYAKETLHFGQQCQLSRWAHSDACVVVDPGCHLFGRVSARERIIIHGACLFSSLTAPHIQVGDDDSGSGASLRSALASDTMVVGDIISRKPLVLPQGVRRRGSIKCYGRLEVGEGSVIQGSLVCCGDIVIHADCVISGPIVADGRVSIGRGCRLGDEGRPTSIAAPYIDLERPSLVFGALHATSTGTVF